MASMYAMKNTQS